MRACYRHPLLPAIGLFVATAALCAAQAAARKPATSAAAQREGADRKDFEIVCGSCHASNMVADVRTELEWKQTVEHMVALGAEGSDEQMEAVMRFLLRTMTKVNVNTAVAAELLLVLDISEPTAQAVVKYRSEHGNFKTLDDLKKVPGINAARLNARKDRVIF